MLENSPIIVNTCDLPIEINEQKTQPQHVRALFSKMILDKWNASFVNYANKVPTTTFGNYHCRRCHSRLVNPPNGQFIKQTRRADEPASIILFCQTCNENKII